MSPFTYPLFQKIGAAGEDAKMKTEPGDEAKQAAACLQASSRKLEEFHGQRLA